VFPKIPTGEYVHEPDVQYFPAKRIEVTSDPPALLDIDGDIFGTTPAVFTVCPRAVEILSPQ
jgi:diacylglycerol kinase family enzyme